MNSNYSESESELFCEYSKVFKTFNLYIDFSIDFPLIFLNK